MTSLSNVYEGGVRTVVNPRKRWLAISLFAVGGSLVAAAVLLTTTGLRPWLGLEIIEARHIGGVLAGIGLPVAIVGIFAALPANDETRAAAAIGASVAIFGVLLFAYAYPDRWLSNDPALALATTGVYTLGTLITFWCLFVAVAMFKTRKNPGGTARVKITDEGNIRLVSGPPEPEQYPEGGVPSFPGLGGVGVFGKDPDGNVPTQTNVDDTSKSGTSGTASNPAKDGGATILESSTESTTPDDTGHTAEPGTEAQTQSRTGSQPQSPTGSQPRTEAQTQSHTEAQAQSQSPTRSESRTGHRSASTGPTPTSDGGSSIADEGAPEVIDETSDRGKPDIYCGNCAYFEYVEVSGDLDPYCGYHQEFMEDLDACDQWTANIDEA